MQRRSFISACIAALTGACGWKGKEVEARIPTFGSRWPLRAEPPKWEVAYEFTNSNGASWKSYCIADEFDPHEAAKLLGQRATLIVNGVSQPMDLPLTRIEYSRNGFTGIIQA